MRLAGMFRLSAVPPLSHKEVEADHCERFSSKPFFVKQVKASHLLPSLVTNSCFMMRFLISDYYLCTGSD
jgi:hypothetical protein